MNPIELGQPHSLALSLSASVITRAELKLNLARVSVLFVARACILLFLPFVFSMHPRRWNTFETNQNCLRDEQRWNEKAKEDSKKEREAEPGSQCGFLHRQRQPEAKCGAGMRTKLKLPDRGTEEKERAC
jgi:hypothetical protein